MCSDIFAKSRVNFENQGHGVQVNKQNALFDMFKMEIYSIISCLKGQCHLEVKIKFTQCQVISGTVQDPQPHSPAIRPGIPPRPCPLLVKSGGHYW